MSVSNTQKILPMLWMNGTAGDAAELYCRAFPNSTIGNKSFYSKEGFEIHGQKEGTVMTVDFELDGFKLITLNGGPVFQINPSISFYVTCENKEEVDKLWDILSEGGKILMPLDNYPWSEKYGWLEDRFGVTWQISLGKLSDVNGNRIVPFLMFTKEHHGKAEEAMNRYVSIFRNSSVTGALKFASNEAPEIEGTIKHAQFVLENQTFMIMESALDHKFSFNEAVSLIIQCKDQEEVDYYWDKLTADGDPESQICGWLKDKYGVSWQVVPTILSKMLQDPDKNKVNRVTKAFLQMKKFDIDALVRAFEG